MRDYFKRLKEHPGVPVAFFMTIAGAMAGAQNRSFPIVDGMIFGACVAGGVCWTIVLITNRK